MGTVLPRPESWSRNDDATQANANHSQQHLHRTTPSSWGLVRACQGFCFPEIPTSNLIASTPASFFP